MKAKRSPEQRMARAINILIRNVKKGKRHIIELRGIKWTIMRGPDNYIELDKVE